MSALFMPVEASALPDAPNAPQGPVITPSGQRAGYVAGTRIATPMGYVAIERLQPGDRVLTAAGRHARILGVDAMEVGSVDADTAPVCFRLSSYDNIRPLRLAQGHCLCVASSKAEALFGSPAALIPAKAFVDGATVFIEESGDPVIYVNLIFERHEIILAENVPCGSISAEGASFAKDVPGHGLAHLALL